MRKSRASHVKCDCGEKSHKCAHLQTNVEGHRDGCCCNHGGRCTCSHKKEAPSLDPVPESDSDDPRIVAKASSKGSTAKSGSGGGVRSRRRANTIHSDGIQNFDEHGNHKPTFKAIKASSKIEPYPLRRVNSMHSASVLSSRSADSLVCDSRGAPRTSAAARREATTRRVKSETASPLIPSGGGSSTGNFAQLNQQLPPLDLSSIEYPRYVAHGNGFDMFSGLSDHEQPIFSAGLSAASVDWSHYDGLDMADGRNGNAGTGTFTPSSHGPHSYSGAFDFGGSEQAPTLTTTTSGDVSEAEDFMGPSPDDFDVTGGFNLAPSSSAAAAAAAAAASLSTIDFDDFQKLPKDPTLGTTLTDESFAEDQFYWITNNYQPHGLPLPDSAEHNGLFWDTT